MLIISVRINENNRGNRNAKTKQNSNNNKKTKTKITRKGWEGGGRSYNENVRAKWFCFAFKLDFLQLTYKASLIFQSNLELALSIILKQRELYEPKHVAVECRCLKIWDLLSFLICSSILVLKWRQVSPI